MSVNSMSIATALCPLGDDDVRRPLDIVFQEFSAPGESAGAEVEEYQEQAVRVATVRKSGPVAADTCEVGVAWNSSCSA